MKAAVYRGKRTLNVEEIETPTPAEAEVLIKVKYSAICGTDVHAFLYDAPPIGTVMGHEYCGTVTAVGPGVTRFSPGDRVIGGGGTPPPGKELALRVAPRYNYRTDGFAGRMRGYAEYVINDEWTPLPVPDDVSDEAAALCEPCAIAVHTTRLSGIKIGDVVAVLGAGPIGFFCAQVAKAAGASTVIVSEPVAARAKAVASAGADIVVDPTTEDFASVVLEASNGLGADVILDCAGARPTLNQALNAVRREGSVVLVAVVWEEIPLVPVDWMGREVHLHTSFGSLPRDWEIALDLLRSGKVVVEPILSPEQVIPLDDIQQAFDSLLDPSTQLQIIVRP